jgi:hypothetical protein
MGSAPMQHIAITGHFHMLPLHTTFKNNVAAAIPLLADHSARDRGACLGKD